MNPKFNYKLMDVIDGLYHDAINEQLSSVLPTSLGGGKVIGKGSDQYKKKVDFSRKYITVKIPYSPQYKASGLVLPKDSSVSYWKHPINVYSFSPSYKEWEGTPWESYIPTNDMLEAIFPEGTLRSFTVPDGQHYNATIKRIAEPPHLQFQFNWFFDGDNQPYQQPFKPEELPNSMRYKDETWWEQHWQLIAQVVGGLAIGILTGGMSIIAQLGIEFAFNSIFTVIDISKGDNFAAGLGLIFSLIPGSARLLINKGLLGGIAKNELNSLVSKVATWTDEEIAKDGFLALNDQEKLIFTRVFSNQKDVIIKATSKTLFDSLYKAFKEGSLELTKIPVAQRTQWKDFVYQLAISAGIVTGAVGVKANMEKNELVKELTTFGDEMVNKMDISSDRLKAYIIKTNPQYAKEKGWLH
jgi:hypothetical protein